MSLLERYFGNSVIVEKEDEADRERAHGEIIAKVQWFRMPHMDVFRSEVETLLDRFEPEPGPHEEMLYRAGTRNGLLMVKKYLLDIERQSEGEEV